MHFSECYCFAGSSTRCAFIDEDINKIKRILQNAHMKWLIIGMKLKIANSRLQAIKKQHKDSSVHCFNAMIDEWLMKSPKLALLVEVLRYPEINLADIAETLEGKPLTEVC